MALGRRTKSYNEQMRADYQKAIGELPDQPIDVAFVPADLRLVSSMSGTGLFYASYRHEKCVPDAFLGSYEVLTGFFTEPCTTEYRSRIREIQTEGQVFDIQSQTRIMKNSVK